MENIEMTEQELRKSIEALVNEAYPELESKLTEVVAQEVVQEVAKSETPVQTETVVAVEEVKAEIVEEVAKSEPVIEVSNTEKSLGNLSKEEVELIQAWRAELANPESVIVEEVTKSVKQDNNEEMIKSLKESFSNEISNLTKSLQAKEDMLKSMSEQLKVLSNQPAYDTKSITSLDIIKKSEDNDSEKVIGKKDITNIMLKMQLEGKLPNAGQYISEFEATGNISNERIQKLVFDTIK